ncbi:MAG: pentapeptide repeat-containing protein [Candidatus Thiodiazotropha sp.]
MSSQEQNTPQGWYIRHEGLITGPHAESRIRQHLMDGTWTLSDEISVDKKSWQPLLSVPQVVPLQMRAEAGDAGARAQIDTRAKLSARERAETRRIPLIPLLVVTLVLGAAVSLALLLNTGGESDSPLCDAPPGPGVNWRNCVLVGIDAGSASLAGANLNSTVLRDAQLSATDLSDAHLDYADLRAANLSYARLQRASLLGANLQGADLREADLSGADLRFADFTDSRVKGMLLNGAHLDEAIWVDGRSCAAGSVGVCRFGK